MVNKLKKKMIIGSIFIIILLTLTGCTSLTLNTIEPTYTYIQSYPGGGGIFLLQLSENATLEENISIELIADPELRAQLTNTVFTQTNPTGELIIRPTENITEGISKIIILSKNDGLPKTKILEVELFDIEPEEPSRYIIDKRNGLLDWLSTTYPEYENISNQTWFAYRTYVRVLEVEHWTFLSSDYELRICCHITIEPDNWSEMLLRPRGEITPVIAAHQEYDGSTHELNISEYPTFYGY